MEKKVTSNIFLTKASDLVTSRDKTRSGFIAMALEKNLLAGPYIDEARILKVLASKVSRPIELLNDKDLRTGLLTASGLSDKALNYLTDDDRTLALKGLIEEFLIPAGANFVDELVYRYLLTKGDALGGKARNLAGSLGERKYMRTMISVMKLKGISFKWFDGEAKKWLDPIDEDSGIEKRVKGLSWKTNEKNRLLLTNIGVPLIKKNVDLVLLEGEVSELTHGPKKIISEPAKYIALGELKGGIDPAGADEHWKTANSALGRISTAFGTIKLSPHRFFIGAAIESAMSVEIFNQLEAGIISNAANLTYDEQLTELCSWVLEL